MKKIIKVTVKVLAILIAFIAVLFIHFYNITSGEYNVAKTVAQDKSIPHIKINNTIFHAETFGSDTNDVVIVIHGGPGNDYRYLLSLKELSDNYFVVFYDQRGTGLSPRVPIEELTLENMLIDLHDIIEYYAKGRKVNLIGHSWGAMLASGYIAQHPDKVNKVVLAEPGILTEEKADEFMEKAKPEMNFAFLKHIGRCWFQSLHIDELDDQASSDYFFQSLLMNADLSLIEKHPIRNYLCDDNLNDISVEYWRYSSLSNKAIFLNNIDEAGKLKINLVSGVENFNNKVLFMTGECNTLIGAEYQEGHMKYFNETELVVIKNTGHFMFEEQPEESIGAVRRYFKE